MTFAAQLTAALARAGMSKAELARRIPCRRSAITNYAMGRNVPRRDMLRRINEVLGARLTVSGEHIYVEEVAREMGCCGRWMRRAMRSGAFAEIGVAVPSATGKRWAYRFYPGMVAQLVRGVAPRKEK